MSEHGSADAGVPAPDPWLRPEEAAAHLKVCVETIERAARRGELPGYRLGRRWRFRLSAVNAFMEAQRWTR